MKTVLAILAVVIGLASFSISSTASACGDVSGCVSGWSNYTYNRAYNYHNLHGASWRSVLGYLQYQNIRNNYHGANLNWILTNMSHGGRTRALNAMDPSYGLYSSYRDN